MRVKVLDHGYVELVESWGSDERIIEAARMSTGKGFQGWGPIPCQACERSGRFVSGRGAHIQECKTCNGTGKVPGDEKLLRYLYEHKHSTPFEMAGMTIEVQAPIFVFREWHRHRTQSYNEMSARYVPLPDVNYVPTVERCIVVPGQNRQARGSTDKVPTHDEVLAWLASLEISYEAAQYAYELGLKFGIPKEIARLPVPVGRYSRMRASANLRNWLAFLTLRMTPQAQWEIRQYANEVALLIKQNFPRTYDLFAEVK